MNDNAIVIVDVAIISLIVDADIAVLDTLMSAHLSWLQLLYATCLRADMVKANAMSDNIR